MRVEHKEVPRFGWSLEGSFFESRSWSEAIKAIMLSVFPRPISSASSPPREIGPGVDEVSSVKAFTNLTQVKIQHWLFEDYPGKTYADSPPLVFRSHIPKPSLLGCMPRSRLKKKVSACL